MISKELLSEVLDDCFEHKPDYIDIISGNKIWNNIKQTIIAGYNDCSEPIEVNIYELAHKVKEWAFDNKYIITCSPLITELKWKKHSVRLTHFYSASKGRAIYDEFGSNGRIEANTEVEAIFKAGEFILKEIKK